MWCTKHEQEENEGCQKCGDFERECPDDMGNPGGCIWLSPAKGIELIFV